MTTVSAKFATEVDLMLPLVKLLRTRCDVVRENLRVHFHGQLIYPDIVTIHKTGECAAFYDVFEGKLDLNDEVVRQAKRLREYCHRSWIVVPAMDPENKLRALRRRLLGVMNLGLICVDAETGKVSFQDQPKHYTNRDPDLSMLEVAMEMSPPASADKLAGAPSVQPSRALKNFGDVIRYIEANGPTSTSLLIKARVLKHSDRMKLIRAIEHHELTELAYAGKGDDVQLAASEVKA